PTATLTTVHTVHVFHSLFLETSPRQTTFPTSQWSTPVSSVSSSLTSWVVLQVNSKLVTLLLTTLAICSINPRLDTSSL
ncbi:hypothetical protein HDU99_008959, partial [Rhizoclosmatium hyalinum]